MIRALRPIRSFLTTTVITSLVCSKTRSRSLRAVSIGAIFFLRRSLEQSRKIRARSKSKSS